MKNEKNKDWGLPENFLEVNKNSTKFMESLGLDEETLMPKIKAFFDNFLKTKVKKIQTPSMENKGFAMHVDKKEFLQEMINHFEKNEILFFAFNDLSNAFDRFTDFYFSLYPQRIENLPEIEDKAIIEEADAKFKREFNNQVEEGNIVQGSKYPDVNAEDTSHNDICDRH